MTEEPYREPLDPDEEIPEDEPNLKAVYSVYGAKRTFKEALRACSAVMYLAYSLRR